VEGDKGGGSSGGGGVGGGGGGGGSSGSSGSTSGDVVGGGGRKPFFPRLIFQAFSGSSGHPLCARFCFPSFTASASSPPRQEQSVPGRAPRVNSLRLESSGYEAKGLIQRCGQRASLKIPNYSDNLALLPATTRLAPAPPTAAIPPPMRLARTL
jgi:hypothetical protein